MSEDKLDSAYSLYRKILNGEDEIGLFDRFEKAVNDLPPSHGCMSQFNLAIQHNKEATEWLKEQGINIKLRPGYMLRLAQELTENTKTLVDLVGIESVVCIPGWYVDFIVTTTKDAKTSKELIEKLIDNLDVISNKISSAWEEGYNQGRQ